MKNKVFTLIAFFGLFMATTQSCSKQEHQTMGQTIKKSGDEMTYDEFVESLDIVDEVESPNSLIEGLTSSGSYVVVSSSPDLNNPPDYFDGASDKPELCCTATVSDAYGSGSWTICCWAYDCIHCSCVDVMFVGSGGM